MVKENLQKDKEAEADNTKAPARDEFMAATKTDSSQSAITSVHVKCRQLTYLGTDKTRQQFDDGSVDWNVKFDDYKPTQHTADSVVAQPVWADPPTTEGIKFNQFDGGVNRTSHGGTYQLVEGKPRNPKGRTGMSDRGLLGKWGPNHAADPIISRWKRGASNEILQKDGKNILEIVTIQRKDTKEWAIPGGMCDPGENLSLTLKREFGEEAMQSIDLPAEERVEVEKHIDELFKGGMLMYKGYVDDPRNTDNAWMETVAVNFHDEQGHGVAKIPLTAGDDAQAVQWLTIDRLLNLYASHANFVRRVCEERNAFWADS